MFTTTLSMWNAQSFTNECALCILLPTVRDIVDYLKQKSRPAVQYISSLMELVPLTDQFEAGQMQEAGFFSIVLGAFTPADEADPNKVATFTLI